MRKKKKRGISPLIATVLIIGFVIVLASMVFIWGGEIFEKYKSETEAESMTKLTCATKINLNIKEACDLGASIKVKLENQADQKIESLIYRAISPSGAAVEELKETLSPFEIKTFYLKYFAFDSFYTKPNKIELLPRVIIEGKEQTCPGTSKEIKPCYSLPSLNSWDDWDFTGEGEKGLITNNKEIIEELEGQGLSDEIGIYAESSSGDMTITSKELFIIPPEATSFFIRVLGRGEGFLSYRLIVGETPYTDSEVVHQGNILIGNKFILGSGDIGENAKIEVTKTGGGIVAITNIGYNLA